MNIKMLIFSDFLKVVCSSRMLGLFLIFFSLSSCFITNTPGFYSGYKRLTQDQKSRVIIVNDKESLPTLIDSNVYAITATHLADLVKKQTPCIIYFWKPFCQGTACIPVLKFQQFCKTNGYNSIIVVEYFDFEELAIQGIKYSEVFAINHWHYGTDFCQSYLKKFQKTFFELFGASYNKKAFNKFLYFDGKALTNQKPATLSKYPFQ